MKNLSINFDEIRSKLEKIDIEEFVNKTNEKIIKHKINRKKNSKLNIV